MKNKFDYRDRLPVSNDANNRFLLGEFVQPVTVENTTFLTTAFPFFIPVEPGSKVTQENKFNAFELSYLENVEGRNPNDLLAYGLTYVYLPIWAKDLSNDIIRCYFVPYSRETWKVKFEGHSDNNEMISHLCIKEKLLLEPMLRSTIGTTGLIPDISHGFINQPKQWDNSIQTVIDFELNVDIVLNTHSGDIEIKLLSPEVLTQDGFELAFPGIAFYPRSYGQVSAKEDKLIFSNTMKSTLKN